MKNPSTPRDPSSIVNRTVTPRRPRNADLREREYLTPKEVDRLQDAARKHSRYGHRDATAILIAYRLGAGGRVISGPPTGLFSLRSAEFNQRFLMQDPNLSQVSLRLFNVVPYGLQLFAHCNRTSMIQRGFKAIDAKCSTSGKGISLLYSAAG
jgi:hypothetical protein